MILNDRDIYRRCQVKGPWGKIQQPMIWPFVDHKEVHPACGFSYGLSGSSYDLRVAEDVVLPPNPIYALAERLGQPGAQEFLLQRFWHSLPTSGVQSQLAHTLEWLTIPDDVCAFVVDKSSYARQFVSALNTLFDPGFQGHGVLEMVNLSNKEIVIRAGEPIVQMVFHKLTGKATPYRGKYYGQTGTVGTRRERHDGSWAPER